MIKRHYRPNIAMDEKDYRELRRIIGRMRWKQGQPPWRFQDDQVNLEEFSRYDQEWDDIHLIRWGPFTVTDRGSIDVDTSLSGLQKFWEDGFEDIVLIPGPPTEPPRELLVGKSVRFKHSMKVRISSSKIFKTFYKHSSTTWGEHLIDSARYARLRVGFDLYTHILKRKYFGSDLEFRIYPSGRWMAFLNVSL